MLPASLKLGSPVGSRQPLLIFSLPAESPEGTARAADASWHARALAQLGHRGKQRHIPPCPVPARGAQPPRSLARCSLLLSIY